MWSCEPLHLLSACVCMRASEHVLRLVLSPPATRTWWMDKRSISVTLHFHHLLGLPLCKSAFPSPPSFSGSHTHTCTHVFSQFFTCIHLTQSFTPRTHTDIMGTHHTSKEMAYVPRSHVGTSQMCGLSTAMTKNRQLSVSCRHYFIQ